MIMTEIDLVGARPARAHDFVTNTGTVHGWLVPAPGRSYPSGSYSGRGIGVVRTPFGACVASYDHLDGVTAVGPININIYPELVRGRIDDARKMAEETGGVPIWMPESWCPVRRPERMVSAEDLDREAAEDAAAIAESRAAWARRDGAAAGGGICTITVPPGSTAIGPAPVRVVRGDRSGRRRRAC